MDNREKLANMSNKELAEILGKIPCYDCIAYGLCHSRDDLDCEDVIELYLESEVEYMRVEIKTDCYPSVQEIVKSLWKDFDSMEGAEILLEVMSLRQQHYTDWLLQLEYISEELAQNIILKGGTTKEEIIEFCDELKKHLLVEFDKGEK